jgi:hypothetical protein
MMEEDDKIRALRNQVQDAEFKERVARGALSDLKAALRDLLGLVKNFIVGLWWVLGIGGTAALWFWKIPETRLQAILFAVVSVTYALLSKALYKAKAIQGKYE